MKKTLAIIKKDLKIEMFGFVIILITILGWDLFLFSRMNENSNGVLLILSLIPLLVFPCIILRNGYVGMKKEWDEQTIYLVMSLPLKGKWILFSKFMTAFLYYILSMIFSLAMSILLFKKDFEYIFNFGYIKQIGILIISFMVFIGVLYYFIGQTSYLVSKIYIRFTKSISLVIGIIGFYLVFRFGNLLGKIIFSWVLSKEMNILLFGNMISMTISLSFLLGNILVIVGLFFVNVWIFEKCLEV